MRVIFLPNHQTLMEIPITGNDDEAIWQLALEQGFVIVSKDSDFLRRSLLRGHPPKVIQVRMGNSPTRNIQELFTREMETIQEFFNNPNEALLIIS